MFIMDEETGDAVTRQGDTFSISVSGITDGWQVFFSVYRGSDRSILFEIESAPSNDVTTFDITAAQSNLMTVPNGKKTEIYYYGIKRCKEVDGKMVEDTVIIGNKDVGDLNKITVYPLTTEGVENGTGESN